MDYTKAIFAFVISSIISLCEIMNKYRRTKREALNGWAIVYFVFNGATALVVFLCIDYFEWKLGGLSDKTANGWVSVIVAGTSWQMLIKMKFAKSETKIPIVTSTFTELFEDGIKQSHLGNLVDLKRKISENYQARIEELLQKIEPLIQDKDKKYIDELVKDEDIYPITDFIIENLGSSWVRKNLLRNG